MSPFDRFLMTPEKANLFVHETVLIRKGKRKAGIDTHVSYSTLNKYASGLRFIHKKQKDAGANSLAEPRSGPLGELLSALHYEDYSLKKRLRYDKAEGMSGI